VKLARDRILGTVAEAERNISDEASGCCRNLEGSAPNHSTAAAARGVRDRNDDVADPDFAED
jgi:hypothetical protein